jgi:hypothetical protein
MDKDKSIIERFTDTVREVAKTATEAASEALKPDPPSRVEERAAGYVPLAADGLVSDPLMVPPVAEPRKRRRRAPPKRTAKKNADRTGKPAKKARKSTARATKKAARKSSKKAGGRSASKTRNAKMPSRRRAAKSRRR